MPRTRTTARPRPSPRRRRRPPPPHRCRGDAGQAGLLVGLVVVALAVVAAMVVARLGDAVAERTRARTAADAAALAGVTGGRRAAAEVARANGGVLEAYVEDGPEVEATVVVGSTRASARAAPADRPAKPAIALGRGARSVPAIGSSSTCSEPARPPDRCRASGFP